MADLKISQLTSATTPLAGTEVLPVVQSGTTKKVSVADLTAGRDTSVKNLTATGDVSVTTAGSKAAVDKVTTQRRSKSSVAAGGTAVLTITPVTTISTHTQISVLLNVAYSASTNLQYHARFDSLTCNSATSGGGTALAVDYDGSVGNFAVASANFVVTRPGSGQIVITYTNANGGGNANNIEFAITGLFDSATIA